MSLLERLVPRVVKASQPLAASYAWLLGVLDEDTAEDVWGSLRAFLREDPSLESFTYSQRSRQRAVKDYTTSTESDHGRESYFVEASVPREVLFKYTWERDLPEFFRTNGVRTAVPPEVVKECVALLTKELQDWAKDQVTKNMPPVSWKDKVYDFLETDSETTLTPFDSEGEPLEEEELESGWADVRIYCYLKKIEVQAEPTPAGRVQVVLVARANCGVAEIVDPSDYRYQRGGLGF